MTQNACIGRARRLWLVRSTGSHHPLICMSSDGGVQRQEASDALAKVEKEAQEAKWRAIPGSGLAGLSVATSPRACPAPLGGGCPPRGGSLRLSPPLPYRPRAKIHSFI